MQVMGVTGKIYNMKPGQTGNGKDKVSFRIGVRKQFVTDQDKQDNKTLTFMPMIAMGPTAKFIMDFFKDGDMIAIGNMEYQTYRTQNAPNEFDDAHIFKVGSAGFCGGGDGGNGGGNGGGGNRGNGGGNNNSRQSNNNNNNNRGNNNNNRGNGGGRSQEPVDNNYNPNDDLPF